MLAVYQESVTETSRVAFGLGGWWRGIKSLRPWKKAKLGLSEQPPSPQKMLAVAASAYMVSLI